MAFLLGRSLKIYEATISLSRPSVARIYTEVDLLKELPSRLWLGTIMGDFISQLSMKISQIIVHVARIGT